MTIYEALDNAELGTHLVIGGYEGRANVYRKTTGGMWVMEMDHTEDYLWYGHSIAAMVDKLGVVWSLS